MTGLSLRRTDDIIAIMAALTIEVDDELFARKAACRSPRDYRYRNAEALAARCGCAAAESLRIAAVDAAMRWAWRTPLTNEQVKQILDEERMRKYGTG